MTVYSYDSYARLSEVQRFPSGLAYPEDVCQQVDYYYDGYTPTSSSFVASSMGHLSAIQYFSSAQVPLANAYPSCYTTFTEQYTYGVPGAPTGKELTVSRTYNGYSDESGSAWWVTPSLNFAATYTYDTEGRITNETYPSDTSGNTANLSYTFDSMGRLYTMTDNLAGQQIIQDASYGPANELTFLDGGSYLGARSGETRTYNSIKQLTGIGTYGVMNIAYNYPAMGNNGKVASQHDAISGETVTYQYDSLNRLATATNSGAGPAWGQSFSYDGFGNLTNTSIPSGCSGCSAPTFTQTYDVNNHAGGEDANGNPSYVPLPAQSSSAPGVYDVENRLVQITGGWSMPDINYAYDPANHRVWRYNGNNTPATDEITFWSITGQKLGTYQITFTQGYDFGGDDYHAPSFTCAQTGTNYYFGAKLLKDNNGWVYADRLGSIGKYYPYGIERPSATTNDTEKFTGYFRDAESGNDYAVNRYQSPGYGRFLTPDPYSSPKATDPGSWNKYAYTRGDPVNRVDRAGTDDDDPDCIGIVCQFIDTFGGGDASGYCASSDDPVTCLGELTALGDLADAGGSVGGCPTGVVLSALMSGSLPPTNCGGVGDPTQPTQEPPCLTAIGTILYPGIPNYYAVERVLNENSFGLVGLSNISTEDLYIASALENRATSTGYNYHIRSGVDPHNINNQALYSGGVGQAGSFANVTNLVNTYGSLPLNDPGCQSFLQDINLAIQAIANVTGSPSGAIAGVYYWAVSGTPKPRGAGSPITTINNTTFYGQ